VVALLDVSVLVALFNGGHADHDIAHDWFADNRRWGWASCPLTENGVLRVLGNPTQLAGFVPVPQLLESLKRFCAATEHHFWPDDLSLRDRELFNVRSIRGHRQLTDVYLLGLAVKRAGRFVTFDRNVPLAGVKGARGEHLEVIAAAE
jgi:toxin-antitoxin system PIN domain toxin